ncbi:MAG: hypothetical protein P1P82_03335 [Bacteroidales bacterium]|nr:hypothetical protein [Bacteroidales bacterium]MDT8432003.1 hypothetical protein [Bacteroidales bacterium]
MRNILFLFSAMILFSGSSGNHGKLKYFKADPDKGYEFPFYLFIPDDISRGDSSWLVVEPNNTGMVSDRLRDHREKARRTASLDYYIGNYVATRLDCPLLVPVFPRPASQNKMYTHSLDRDVMLQKNTPLERLDLQLLAMVEETRDYLARQEIRIPERFLMTGFSASGTFLNRFTLMHPEHVAAAAAGGLNGLLALPLEELDGVPLEYPLGTYDFEQLFGKTFDPEEFRQTPQYLFMGAEDTNDAIPYADGYDEPEREKIYRLLGEEMQPARWERCAGIYREQEVDAVIRTIPGLGHAHPDSIKDEIVQFFREHIR